MTESGEPLPSVAGVHELGIERSFLILGLPSQALLRWSNLLTLPGISWCDVGAIARAASAQEYWTNAEKMARETCCAIYGNTDPLGLFVLPALLAARPLTQVAWIEVSIEEAQSAVLAHGGEPLRGPVIRWFKKIAGRYRDAGFFDLVIKSSELEDLEKARVLWDFCLPAVPMERRMELPFVPGRDHRLPGSLEKFSTFVASELETIISD